MFNGVVLGSGWLFFLPFSDTICTEESDPGELYRTVRLWSLFTPTM